MSASAYPEIWWPILTIQIVSILFQTPLLLAFIYNFCYRYQPPHTHTNTRTMYKCTAITTIVLNMVHSISWMLSGMSIAFHVNLPNNFNSNFLSIIHISTSSLVCLCMYIFLMLQLYQLFQDTAYAASKYKYIFAHGINIVFICFSVSLLIMDADTFFADIYLVLISIGFAELLYTFNFNLYSMVLHQRQTIVDKAANYTTAQKLTHEETLPEIRKHAVLAFFIVFANLCLIISSLMAAYLTQIRPNVIVETICSVLYVIVVCLCVNGAPFCMYLAFETNATLYRKLCVCFDIRLETACNVVAQNRLNRQDSSVRMQDFDDFGQELTATNVVIDESSQALETEHIPAQLDVETEAQYPSLYV